MKTQQVTSILLCLLLSSTFAHDYLRAREYAPSKKHLAGKSVQDLSSLEDRSAASQQCSLECNVTGTLGDLQLIINSTTELIGVVNITASVALVIDINANLIALFNGTSGAVVVVNITSQTGVYIAAGLTTLGWISSNISFASYFHSLTSLSVFFSLNVGVKFTLKNVTTAVLKVIASLLISLSVKLAAQIETNLSAALTILIQIGVELVLVFKGSLKLLLTVAGAGLIKIHGDIVWLVGVLKGLVIFFGYIQGGLSALIAKGVRFELDVILASASGIQLFINLLLAIVVKVNLSLIAGVLNNFQLIVGLIVELGGNVSTGATGVFKVLGGVLSLQAGNISVGVFVGLLFEFAASGHGEIDISVYFEALVQVVAIQNSTHGSSAGLSGFISIVTQLSSGSLTIAGLSISGLIKLLTASASSSINLIIAVLFFISKVVSFSISVTTLILHIIVLLSSTAGSLLVQAVFPSIKISISGSGGGALAIILSGFNLVSILTLITKGIVAFLKSLPIIGDIYTAISAAVKVVSNGSTSLDVSVSGSASGSIVAQIFAFIKGHISVTLG